MIFLVATGIFVRKTSEIFKKRTMSEDFILSQVLLIAFLQSCLILEHVETRKNKKNSVGSGMFHTQEIWMTVSVLVFCDSINGLFVLCYLHKSNLFFTEFEFKGCVRYKISREWTLKGNRAERDLRLICRHLDDLRSGGGEYRSEGESKHLKWENLFVL